MCTAKTLSKSSSSLKISYRSSFFTLLLIPLSYLLFTRHNYPFTSIRSCHSCFVISQWLLILCKVQFECPNPAHKAFIIWSLAGFHNLLFDHFSLLTQSQLHGATSCSSNPPSMQLLQSLITCSFLYLKFSCSKYSSDCSITSLKSMLMCYLLT